MALATLAAPLSLLVTLRERGEAWNMSSVGQVLAGMCVGIGLMVNNTVAQVQGFFLPAGEFVRTPKGTRHSSRGEALWAFPLLFWGMCVALVVRLQLSAQPA